MKRVGFFGDGQWAINSLLAIQELEDVRVEFVVGRWPIPDEKLKILAHAQRIPFFCKKSVNSDAFLQDLSKFEAEMFVSVSYDQIFRRSALSLPLEGIINCHAGKLPFYRGRNVLNWVLINDEKEFGVTVHYVDEGVDTGDIIYQEVFEITDSDDYQTLLTRSYDGCAAVVKTAMAQLISGLANPLKQSSVHPTGFYCSARREGDELIRWDRSSRDIFNFVRALTPPGPGARTFNSGNPVTVNRVEYVSEAPVYVGIPGAVLDAGTDHLSIKTGDSFVRVVGWDSERRIRIGDRLQ